MVTALLIAMFAWMLGLTYFLTRLSKSVKSNERTISELIAKVRGLRLAVRILGARPPVDSD
jgi:hypothetical protein